MSNFIKLSTGEEMEINQANLEMRSTPILLEVHNELAGRSTTEIKPLQSWKQAKQKLIDRILGMVDHEPQEETAPAEKPAEKAKMSKKGKAALASAAKAVKAAKPGKAKPKAKLPKSFRMLEVILEAGDKGINPADLADELETSAGSVNSYRSYFRTGAKGHPQIDITVFAGKLILEDKAVKAAQDAITERKGA